MNNAEGTQPLLDSETYIFPPEQITPPVFYPGLRGTQNHGLSEELIAASSAYISEIITFWLTNPNQYLKGDLPLAAIKEYASTL